MRYIVEYIILHYAGGLDYVEIFFTDNRKWINGNHPGEYKVLQFLASVQAPGTTDNSNSCAAECKK